jgi:hypothetical protein
MNNTLSQTPETRQIKEIPAPPAIPLIDKITSQIKAASILQLEKKLIELDGRLDKIEKDSFSQGEDVGKNAEYQKLFQITGLLQDEIELKKTKLSQLEQGFEPVAALVEKDNNQTSQKYN